MLIKNKLLTQNQKDLKTLITVIIISLHEIVSNVKFLANFVSHLIRKSATLKNCEYQKQANGICQSKKNAKIQCCKKL